LVVKRQLLPAQRQVNQVCVYQTNPILQLGVVASIGRMRQSLKIDIDQRRVQAAAVVKLLKHIEDFLGWTAGKAGHMSRAILCLDDSLNFLAK
jgi:hypothetical protein